MGTFDVQVVLMLISRFAFRARSLFLVLPGLSLQGGRVGPQLTTTVGIVGKQDWLSALLARSQLERLQMAVTPTPRPSNNLHKCRGARCPHLDRAAVSMLRRS